MPYLMEDEDPSWKDDSESESEDDPEEEVEIGPPQLTGIVHPNS